LSHPAATAWQHQLTSLILENVPGLTFAPRSDPPEPRGLRISHIPRIPTRPVLVVPPLLHLHAAVPRCPEITEPVSILLPLRHEPAVALAAVHAAVAQRNMARLDVVVLDVGCTEATYDALSREYGDDPRVRLLDTACLPAGWSRSSHRCQQLAVGARGRILLFADPAAPLGPYAAAAGAHLLRRHHLDLLVLDAGGRRRTGRFAVAADTETYWRIGGHRAAAHDPDPLALLRAMRRARASTGLADGRRVIPAGTRARAWELPPEPREPYFRLRDTGDSTFSSLSTSARRLLAAFRATGAEYLNEITGLDLGLGDDSGIDSAQGGRQGGGQGGRREGSEKAASAVSPVRSANSADRAGGDGHRVTAGAAAAGMCETNTFWPELDPEFDKLDPDD
jgi:hypothetical protein